MAAVRNTARPRLQGQQGGFFDRLFGGNGGPFSAPSGQMGGTFRTICVRTCDGFYFPISFATTPDRFRDDEQTCQRMCPAAEVSLYTYHNPGEEVAQAVSLNGRLYTELPAAFSYRKALNPACSCRRPGESWAEALKANGTDDTVAPGDVVVTEQNAKQLSQPRIGADGKPIRPDPRAKTPDNSAAGDRGGAGRDRSDQAHSAHGRPDLPAGALDLKIERFAFGRLAGDQRDVRRRQRRAGIAEAVGDRIAAVAAEILQRHLDARRRLPALVFGDVEHALDAHHGRRSKPAATIAEIGSSRSTSRSRIGSSTA